MSYPIPADSVETLLEVKKSRFITRTAMVIDRAAAMAFLEQARSDYPDARHHCWAYLLGDPHQPSSVAMSDDGEPSGTAGKPILNVLQHSGIGDLMVVVIRYFGGIKLGAGGLVRAYSAAAQQSLDELPVEERVAQITAQVECDFAEEQYLRHWLTSHEGAVEEASYSARVVLQIMLPEAELEGLHDQVNRHGWSFKIA